MYMKLEPSLCLIPIGFVLQMDRSKALAIAFGLPCQALLHIFGRLLATYISNLYPRYLSELRGAPTLLSKVGGIPRSRMVARRSRSTKTLARERSIPKQFVL